MKSLNNPENAVTSQPFFETFFTKNKKLLYALPVVVVLIIVGLYMTSGKSNAQTVNEENKVDVSLPGAQTKELSNDKLDVMSDFSELNEEKAKQQTKSEQFNVEDVNTNESVPVQTYQNENDKKVVDKVNKMLSEMDKEQKKQKRSYSSSSSNSSGKSYSNYESTKHEVDYEAKNNTETSFNNFFNSSKQGGSVSHNAQEQQQSEQLIYASIKGDHLRLRNNSRVTLILPKETTINGKVFKKNTLIYAQATFNQNRVNLSINNINQVPLKIKAYDAEDGNLGLQVERSLVAETGAEVAKDGADEIDVNGVPLGNTIKSLFKRKQQEPKIDLLNNQRLILKLAQ